MFHWLSLSRPFLDTDGSPCCCTSPVFLSYCSLFENLKYQQYSVPIVDLSRFEQEHCLIWRFQNLGVHFVIPSCMKVGMPFCINAELALRCLGLLKSYLFASMRVPISMTICFIIVGMTFVCWTLYPKPQQKSSQKLLFLQSLPDISAEYLVLLQKEISRDIQDLTFLEV